MPFALELTLILVLLGIAAGLVPLLFQLRRTAQGLDAFLLATRKDLSQMTEDVHASRVRMDHLGVSVQVYLDEVAGFMGVLRGVKEGVRAVTAGIRSALDPASNPMAGLLAGLGAAAALFRRARTPDAPDPERTT
jgi:hypothetical protein